MLKYVFNNQILSFHLLLETQAHNCFGDQAMRSGTNMTTVTRIAYEPRRETRHGDLSNRVSDEMTQMGTDETGGLTF